MIGLLILSFFNCNLTIEKEDIVKGDSNQLVVSASNIADIFSDTTQIQCLFFWNTWCEITHENIELLKNLSKKHKFKIIPICTNVTIGSLKKDINTFISKYPFLNNTYLLETDVTVEDIIENPSVLTNLKSITMCVQAVIPAIQEDEVCTTAFMLKIKEKYFYDCNLETLTHLLE